MTAVLSREEQVDAVPARATNPGDVVRMALIVIAAIVIYAAFIPRIIVALNPLTGDEPFYVMTALSIAHDHDLDEINNYRQRDFVSFYPPDPVPYGWQGWASFPRDLPPHAAHSTRAGLYSKHGLGVAVLITIPWVVGGRVATILLLNLVAALVALNIVLLARRYGLGWPAAVALTVPLAFANPLMSYAYLIFPEIFAALAIVYAFRRSREARNTAWQWLGVGLSLAVLPWLHARFIPALLGLVALLWPVWRSETDWRKRLAGLLPPAVSAVALISYYLAIYSRPFPSAEDHAGFNYPLDIVNAFFGLFLDEQWGLLIHAPIYLLVAAGFGVLWHWRRADARAILAVAVPYLALVAFYRVWWGEWGPPSRYLAPIAPLAIVPLAAWVATARRPLAIISATLLAMPGLAIMAGFLSMPQTMYNQPDGHNHLFTTWAQQLDRTWPKVIPSFQFFSPSPGIDRIQWSLGLVVLILPLFLLGWWAWRRREETLEDETPQETSA